MRTAYDTAKIVLKSERGMIAGVGAIEAPTGTLSSAQAMFTAGDTKETIWQKTGWLRGAERKWKFEIDDSGAEYTKQFKGTTDLQGAIRGYHIKYDKPVVLSDVLKHNQLFKSYPTLKEIGLLSQDVDGANYNPKTNTIQLGHNSTITTLFHEIQHAIQEIEGFAKGGSPAQIRAGSVSEYEQYKRLAGEIEARDTAARAKLTPRQRHEQMPYEAQGIPREDWIITKGKGTSFSVESIKKKTVEITKEEALLAENIRLKSELEAARLPKEVIQKRRGFVKAAADYFNLTDNELKKISRKDIRLMDNSEFKEYITNIRKEAEKFDVKRQAVNELELVQKEKQFVAEDNIRKLHKLPTIKNMTAKQVDEYTGILNKYEEKDQFLTPKEVLRIEKTPWQGSKTIGELIKKASKKLDVPISELKKIRISEIDRLRYDTSLARRSVFHNFMVDEVQTAEIRNALKCFDVMDKMHDLANKAFKTRKRGIFGRLIPRQPRIMKYLEAKGEKKVKAAKRLTYREIEFANYVHDFYMKAYDYLLINNDMQSSRFKDIYVTHSKKPLLELLVDVKDVGLKNTLKDLLNRWRLDVTRFDLRDTNTGDVLTPHKFFKQTLYRAGGVIPTNNVIRVTDIYIRQFFKKVALDECIPTIESLAIALRPQDKMRTGMFLNDSLVMFVNEYLNNKKEKRLVSPGYSRAE